MDVTSWNWSSSEIWSDPASAEEVHRDHWRPQSSIKVKFSPCLDDARIRPTYCVCWMTLELNVFLLRNPIWSYQIGGLQTGGFSQGTVTSTFVSIFELFVMLQVHRWVGGLCWSAIEDIWKPLNTPSLARGFFPTEGDGRLDDGVLRGGLLAPKCPEANWISDFISVWSEL
jgi:hypothetical protein